MVGRPVTGCQGTNGVAPGNVCMGLRLFFVSTILQESRVAVVLDGLFMHVRCGSVAMLQRKVWDVNFRHFTQ